MSWETAWLAVFVFAARLSDVALGTLRHVLVVRGLRALAGCVALAESLVWIFAISRVLSNIDHPTVALAFSLGFAAGTMTGMTIEQYLKLGEQVVRLFSAQGASLAQRLREAGYRVTRFEGSGRDGRVDLLFIQVARRQAHVVSRLARRFDPECFCVVDDVRTIEQAK